MNKYKKILLSLIAIFVIVGLVGCSSNEKNPVDKNPVVDNDDKGEENTDQDTNLEVDDTEVMIANSTYISKIKLITKGNKDSEIKVLDNIKQVITADKLPQLDLQENKTYLVFLTNEGDSVVLTDKVNGLILLEGDNHELFEKINKQVHN